jgi:LPXTG-motif cell wall-anchored protein
VNFDVNYRGITQKQVLIAVGILAIVGVGFWAYKKYKK